MASKRNRDHNHPGGAGDDGDDPKRAKNAFFNTRSVYTNQDLDDRRAIACSNCAEQRILCTGYGRWCRQCLDSGRLCSTPSANQHAIAAAPSNSAGLAAWRPHGYYNTDGLRDPSRVSAPTSAAVPALPSQGGAITVRSSAATPSWTHAATHQLGQHHERTFQSSSQGLPYNPPHPTDYFPSSREPLRSPPMGSLHPPNAQPSAHHDQSSSPPMAFLAQPPSASSSRSDMGPPAAPPPRRGRRASPPPMGRLSPSDCVPSSSLPMTSSGSSPASSQPPSQYATGAASVGRTGTGPQLTPTRPVPAAVSGAVFRTPFNQTNRIQDSLASYHSSTTATDRPLRPTPSGDERATAGDPMLASRGRSVSTSLARRSDASASDGPAAPRGSASHSSHAPSTSRTPSSTIASADLDTHTRPPRRRASRRNTAAPVRDDEPAPDVPAPAAPLAQSGSGGILPSFLQLLESTAPDAPPPPHPSILSSLTTPNSAELGERLTRPNELSLPRPSSRRASEQYAPPDPRSERGLQTGPVGPESQPARQSSISQSLSRRSTSSVGDDGRHGSSTRGPPQSAPTTDNPFEHPPRLLSGPGVPARRLEGVDAGAEHHRGHTGHDAVVSHDRSGNWYVDHSVSGSSVHPQPLRRYDPSADVQTPRPSATTRRRPGTVTRRSTARESVDVDPMGDAPQNAEAGPSSATSIRSARRSKHPK